jgi:death-on-curing protein
MQEPIWIDKPEVLLVHSMQLAEHGGSDGIRDETLLDSALAKPRNVFAYADSTLPRLAASYAFGLARNHAFRNHAFIDGNKRTALVVSEGFLRVNGMKVVSTPEEKYFTFLHLADGSLSEDDLTAWFTQHAVPL